MPRGIPEYKNRNSAARARYHTRAGWNAFAQSLRTTEVKHLIRTDRATGEETKVNRSAMEGEVGFWDNVFQTLNPYSYNKSVVWTEIEKGASFHTEKASFRLVSELAAARAA